MNKLKKKNCFFLQLMNTFNGKKYFGKYNIIVIVLKKYYLF